MTVHSSSSEKLEDYCQQKIRYQRVFFLLDFLLFFKGFYDWGHVDSRKNEREG